VFENDFGKTTLTERSAASVASTDDSGPFNFFRSNPMLGWALTFLIVAIIAAVFGFAGVAGTAAWVAKVLVVVFLVLFLVSLVAGRRTPVP